MFLSFPALSPVYQQPFLPVYSLSFFHSLTLSGKKDDSAAFLFLPQCCRYAIERKTGTKNSISAVIPTADRCQHTQQLWLEFAVVLLAGSWGFFFCNERLLFLLITVAKWFVVHQSLWCIHLIIMMIFFFMVFLMLLLQRCSHDQSLEVRLPAEIQTWVIKNDRIIWFWLSLSSFFFFLWRSFIRLFTKSFDSIISHIGSFWLGTCHCHQFPWPDLLYY